jgi:hypothetical protein
MSWSTEMLVRDRIARRHAEAAHDRLVRSLAAPTRVGRRLRDGWWRGLMGLPVLAPARPPAVGRIA